MQALQHQQMHSSKTRVGTVTPHLVNSCLENCSVLGATAMCKRRIQERLGPVLGYRSIWKHAT